MKRELTSVAGVCNLNAVAFLNFANKQLYLSSKKLSDRPEGMLFFRFSFNLDTSSIDDMIIQEPIFFTFCLSLPQHRYYKTEKKVEENFSPVARRSPEKGKQSKMKGLFGTATKLFATLEKGTEDTSDDDKDGVYDDASVGSAVDDSDDSADVGSKGTPKMNALFGGSSNILIGYFGGLGFIDKQSEFNNTFGSDPVIFPTNQAMVDTTTTTKLNS